MARTGRAREHFEITGGGFVATGKDEEATAKAFEIVRGRVAFYGSTPAIGACWNCTATAILAGN